MVFILFPEYRLFAVRPWLRCNNVIITKHSRTVVLPGLPARHFQFAQWDFQQSHPFSEDGPSRHDLTLTDRTD